MPEENIEKDIKLTKTEQEKQVQAEAARELYQQYPLPENLSQMRGFVWGKFTWRDAIVSFICMAVPMLFFQIFMFVIPQWLCLVFGGVVGIVFVVIANKHIFTGDLPIEERIRIAFDDAGASNLLFWDKTKINGKYSSMSTQSFVPELEFADDNSGIVFLPGNKGGFAVFEITVNDMTAAKFTEKNRTVMGFQRMLNALTSDNECCPIQLMLKSQPQDLSKYIENAMDDISRISYEEKTIMTARAEDYWEMLQMFNEEDVYFYDYYIIVTYREDAEHVGNDSMKKGSVSVKRMQFKESTNPLRKKQEAAADAQFDIGDDRKKKIKELTRDAEFGKKRTRAALEKRISMIEMFVSDLGSVHNEVKPRILGKEEIAKLFFQCYNDSDKNTIGPIIAQAIEPSVTLFSRQMYADFPELFPRNERKKDKMKELQNAGSLGRNRVRP